MVTGSNFLVEAAGRKFLVDCGMYQGRAEIEEEKGLVTLKSTGIVRKVDELGRIVLPIELRRTLDIAEKDSLEIYMDGASIVLKKYQPACIFCDDAQDVITYRGKNVCTRCIKALQEAGE